MPAPAAASIADKKQGYWQQGDGAPGNEVQETAALTHGSDTDADRTLLAANATGEGGQLAVVASSNPAALPAVSVTDIVPVISKTHVQVAVVSPPVSSPSDEWWASGVDAS